MFRRIVRLEGRLPWFNKEPISFEGFKAICREEGVGYYLWDFPPNIRGFYFQDDGGASIAVNPILTECERRIVCCRELGHYFMAHPNGFTLAAESPAMIPLFEYEAKVFGALCLIPTPELERKQDEALEGWPAAFQEFRVSVYQSYLRRRQWLKREGTF